jgi:hypothetical protein
MLSINHAIAIDAPQPELDDEQSSDIPETVGESEPKPDELY